MMICRHFEELANFGKEAFIQNNFWVMRVYALHVTWALLFLRNNEEQQDVVRLELNTDLESNSDLNNDDYEYEDEAKLVIFPDHYEIPLPNIEELPALVTIACDAVLSSKSPYRKQDPDSWEEELQISKHANSLVQMDNGVRIPPSGGNGHALEHFKEMGYPLAVKLGTITPDGADVYSFEEEEAVLDPHIAKHLAHFGIDMLQMHVTENGLRDNEIKPRVSEWEVIQESGMKLKPMYGPGYTGMKNMGNSCYISSVLQAIFSIPEFQRAQIQMVYLKRKGRCVTDTGDVVANEDIFLLGRTTWPQHHGISPRMFKAFVSKGHPEFSSSRQQDALEFFLHLINLIEVSKDELIAYELKRREAETARRPPPEMVRARIPFSACLQAFTEPENVEDFWSSALQAKSAGVKTSRFASFPEYLVVQIKKFTFGLDWIPKKLDVSIDMPDLLDITHLRATGFQPGEEELPDISPPVIIPDDPKGGSGVPGLDNQPPEEIVSIISSMGFQRNVALQALRATNNNLEHALDWIFSHPEPEEETEVASEVMNIENHVNANILAESDPEGPRIKDGPGRYELFGFISHMGTSTMSGHYVCHLKKEGRWVIYNDHKVCASEQPPIELGYIYFYHRIPS
ncbi:hypothetical protein E2320_009182 [Naja naja]|nr:hypothetical protein E2320_009182 [Naja naja]